MADNWENNAITSTDRSYSGILGDLKDITPNQRDSRSARSDRNASTEWDQILQSYRPEQRLLDEDTDNKKTPTAHQHEENRIPPTQLLPSEFSGLARQIATIHSDMQEALDEAQNQTNLHREKLAVLHYFEQERRKRSTERLESFQDRFAKLVISWCYQDTILEFRAKLFEPSWPEGPNKEVEIYPVPTREEARVRFKILADLFDLSLRPWLFEVEDDTRQSLEKEINTTLDKFEKEASRERQLVQLTASMFLYNNLRDAIRELTIETHLDNVEQNLIHFQRWDGGIRNHMLEEARQEASKALEAAKILEYDPLLSRCQFWLGHVAHLRSEHASDNPEADRVEAAGAFLFALTCIGHYREGQMLQDYIGDYIPDMQQVAAKSHNLSKEEFEGLPRVFMDVKNEKFRFEYEAPHYSNSKSAIAMPSSPPSSVESYRNQTSGFKSFSPSYSPSYVQTTLTRRQTTQVFNDIGQQEQDQKSEHSSSKALEALSNTEKRSIARARGLALKHIDTSQEGLNRKFVEAVQVYPPVPENDSRYSPAGVNSPSQKKQKGTARSRLPESWTMQREEDRPQAAEDGSEPSEGTSSPRGNDRREALVNKQVQSPPEKAAQIPQTDDDIEAANESNPESVYRTKPPALSKNTRLRRKSKMYSPNERRPSMFSGSPEFPEPPSPLVNEIDPNENRQDETTTANSSTDIPARLTSRALRRSIERETTGRRNVEDWMKQIQRESNGNGSDESPGTVAPQQDFIQVDSDSESDKTEVTVVLHTPPKGRDIYDKRPSLSGESSRRPS